MLAVTGTDGKTTTTLLAVEMLRAAGLSTVDAGNTETPLVDAIDTDLDAFVVECTSFRLAWTPTFRAEAAAWLNLAPDHLNWHRSMDTYEAAKARIWANQRPDDVGDRLHRRRGRDASARRGARPASVTFGAAGARLPPRRRRAGRAGRRHRRRSRRCGAACPTTSPTRSPPRRSCSRPGSPTLGDRCGAGVVHRTGPPTRTARHAGTASTWYNDSKATTPHAAAAADPAFDRLVLIAGGYDKRVDLAEMAADAGSSPMRSSRSGETARRSRRRVRRRRRRRDAPSPPRRRRASRRARRARATRCCCRPGARASTSTARSKPVATTSASSLTSKESVDGVHHLRPRSASGGARSPRSRALAPSSDPPTGRTVEVDPHQVAAASPSAHPPGSGTASSPW